MSESDPTRQRIIAAIERVLAGEPTSWTVSELSRQAGVGRHLLTQKHTDLRDRFTDRRNALISIRETPTDDHSEEVAQRDQTIRELRIELGDAHATINGISRTVQSLYLENAQVRDECFRLRRQIERLQDQIPDEDRVVLLSSARHSREVSTPSR